MRVLFVIQLTNVLTLLTTVILATFFAFFATQNTSGVSLNFAGYVLPNIPLYLVVLVSFLIGLVLAFFFHTIKDLSSSLAISGEKGKVKKLKEEVTEATKQAHKLELENTRLKAETGEKEDEDSI